MTENMGQCALEEKVILKGLCTMCGACASLCPYLRTWRGRWVKLHDCNLEEGRCFYHCPRTQVDLDAIHRGVFGQGYQDLEMGMVRRIVMARGTDIETRRKAQSGGVVSTLMNFAMKEGMIDSAVLTYRDENYLPMGRVVRSWEEIMACAGSSYVASSTLETLNEKNWNNTERIGVVGTPCQVLALAKMRVSPLEHRTAIDQVSLVMGLFCTWALSFGPFIEFIHKLVNGAKVHKIDITPPPERLMKVNTIDKVWDIPLDDIRPFIRPGCGICLDLTSEFSDLSIGTVEGKEEWNTVLVRTDMGEELLNRAELAGVIEINPLPDLNLQHLKEASLLKKRRAILNLRERGELEGGYLVLAPEQIRTILNGPKEVTS